MAKHRAPHNNGINLTAIPLRSIPADEFGWLGSLTAYG